MRTDNANRALPLVSLDTRGSSDLDGFEIWHELCRPVFETRQEAPQKRFDSAVRFCEIDGMVFGETRYGATRFDRSSAHVKGGESDHLALHFLQSGQEQGIVDGVPFFVSPNRVVLQDWSRPFIKATTEVHQLSVIIPRDLVHLSNALSKSQPFHVWELDSPGGRLLSHTLRAIFDGIKTFTQADASKIGDAFVSLVNSLLASDLKDKPLSTEASFVAVAEYIRKNMRRPDLGLVDVQRDFALSRSSAYRLFQRAGGIRTFIQNERLAACHRDLVKSAYAANSVRQICERWGFRDVSHFYRLFRKRYGLTPMEVREQAGDEANKMIFASAYKSPGISTFHNWIGH